MKKGITIQNTVDAYNALASINLLKFDKSARSAAIKNFASLKSVVEMYEKYQKDIKDKIFESKKEEASIVGELRARLSASKDRVEIMSINHQIISEHSEFIALEEECAQMFRNKGNETVEVDVSELSLEQWIDSLVAAEIDFSPIDINALEFMFTK